MSIQVNFKSKKFEKIFKRMKDLHSEEFIQAAQTEVIDGQIKRLIRSGQSPVEGFGRFVQYKDKDKYPKGQKPATPPNLFLSGNLLRFYVASRKSAVSLVFGISKDASEAVKIRAKANNEGTLALAGKKFTKKQASKEKSKESKSTSGVPARRFIPINGESFTVSVIRSLKNLYAKRIKNLLSNG